MIKKNIRVKSPSIEINKTTADLDQQSAIDKLIALSQACVAQNKHHQALLHLTKAALLAPNNVQVLLSCSSLLFAMRRPDEAVIYSAHALALNTNTSTLSAHGQALYQQGNYIEALSCFERIVTEEPSNHLALGQYALCLTQFNRYDEALQMYQQALALNPANAMLQSNYSLSLLAVGNLLAGFQLFEYRWQAQLHGRARPWNIPTFTDMENLQGKSILIHTEQGLGDSIQFFRYIPLLVQRGAQVTLEIQPSLIPLFYHWRNTVTLIGAGSTLPVCDYHCPMMSLAHLFKTDLATIPLSIPYVSIDATRVDICRKMLPPTNHKRVGITWRGSHLNESNHKRSTTLKTLLAIHQHNLDFICLQQDVTIDEKKLLDEHKVSYYSLELSTFEGTAALISCLDLVVTIDTSIAHLAGAMGKPVWILLPFSPDWRWLLERVDSPWYPSARLFRQTKIGDWNTPLAQVKAECSKLAVNRDIAHIMHQAEQQMQLNAFSQAEQLYQSILAADPYDHRALQGLALVAFQQNNLPRAIQWMQRAAEASPSTPLYQRNLGELLRRAGQLDAAIAAHKVAVNLEPTSDENHYHLGLAFNDNQQYEQAVTHYRIALSCNLNHGLAWNNLGASLERLQDIDGAKAAYTTAIKLNPSHAEAQNNLGAICSEQGHLPEACSHFAAAIGANPDFVEAHYNLSGLKTYTQDDPHLHILNTLTLKVPFFSENARIHYYFALGKALDDTQEFAHAFQAYAEGNKLKYAQEPWDSAHLQRMIDQIPVVFTSSFLKKARKTKDPRQPIFIVGMPRSGTTLIEQILASHGNIYGAGELSILDDVIHSARGATRNTPFTTWVAQLTDKEFAAMGKEYMDRTQALAPGKNFIVDKMPGNCFYIGMIYRMLPRAKIIHAMRDPMDSCFSCFTRLFKQGMTFAYDQNALARYYMLYAEVMKYWHAVLPKGTILDLSYEVMVANHEAESKRLLDYIGLPWDPNCLNFYNNERVVKTASLAQVRKPIYRTSVRRWENFAVHLQTLLDTLAPYRPIISTIEEPV